MPTPPLLAISILVHTQVLMAASAAAILFATSRVLETPLSPWWYAVAGLGTWTIYLLDSARSRNAEDQLSQPERARVFQNSRAIRLVLPVCTAALGILALIFAKPPLEALWLLLILGVLGIAYVIPLLPLGFLKPADGENNGISFGTLKHFALLKPLTICCAWTLGAVLLPALVGNSQPPREAALWLGFLLFPLLLGDTLLLDLRDREGDQQAGISTFAVRVGEAPTHAAVAVCLAVAAVVLLLGSHDTPNPIVWRRVALAGVLGLATAWLSWQALRKNEAATALGLMAWRFLAALAAI